MKLQTYTADSLTLNVNNADVLVQGRMAYGGEGPHMRSSREGALPYGWHQELFQYAEESRADFAFPAHLTLMP